MNDLQLGERFKNIREYLKLSQKELAVLADSHQSHISRIEKNNLMPNMCLLHILATKYKVNINYLFGTSNDIVVKTGYDNLSEPESEYIVKDIEKDEQILKLQLEVLELKKQLVKKGQSK